MNRHSLKLMVIVVALGVMSQTLQAQRNVIIPNPPAREMTVEQAIKELRIYREGDSRQAVYAIRNAVRQSSQDAKDRAAMRDSLIALVADEKVTVDAKRLACGWLEMIGDDRCVPPIVELLQTAATFDMARRTLERIPGEKSLNVLRDALADAKGAQRIGIMQSLGNRRDERSTKAITKLLKSSDGETADTAAAALGQIGSAEAGKALLNVKSSDSQVLYEALLACAEQRRQAGDSGTATLIYEKLARRAAPNRWLAAVGGLAQTDRKAAMPYLIKALNGDDDLKANGAVAILSDVDGQEVSELMVDQIAKLSPSRQAAMLTALGQRGDRSVVDGLTGYLTHRESGVQLAAIETVALLGDARHVGALAQIASDASGNVREAAREGLVRLSGKGVDRAILAGVQDRNASYRSELVRAAAARRIEGVAVVLFELTRAQDADLRAAAYDGLEAVCPPADYPRLVNCLVEAPNDQDRESATAAIAGAMKHLSDRDAKLKPILAALASSNGSTSVALLTLLPEVGGSEALAAVRKHLQSDDSAVRKGAARSVIKWPDVAAADDLFGLIGNDSFASLRSAAMASYLQHVHDADAPDPMIRKIHPLIETAADKRLFLSTISQVVASRSTLEIATGYLRDDVVVKEAAIATVTIADQLKTKYPEAVLSAMSAVRKTKPSGDLLKKVEAIEKSVRRGGSAQLDAPYDESTVTARVSELKRNAPNGYRLAAYVDCGAERASGKAGDALRLHLRRGEPWRWKDPQAVAAGPIGTVVFDSKAVTFEIVGMDPKRAYVLGFTWWDKDANGRLQSVQFMNPSSGGMNWTTVLPAAAPLAHHKGQPTWAQVFLPLAKPFRGHTNLTGRFQSESGANVVVSEMCLFEKKDGKDTESNMGATKRVVIVTGDDIAGHHWRLTSAQLADILRADPRLEVSIVESAALLGSPLLAHYDAVVLNYVDRNAPAPGRAARANLKRFIEEGKGLVVVHFGCGAFSDWKEFPAIAGRVYDPAKRAHDRRGKFHVRITDTNHPITRGMNGFDTVDELYTCLSGSAPIDMLAEATSVVDRRDYPMAFASGPGEGRVFHCTLGHDVQAYEAEGVRSLYRRGTAWACGLSPDAQK